MPLWAREGQRRARESKVARGLTGPDDTPKEIPRCRGEDFMSRSGGEGIYQVHTYT